MHFKQTQKVPLKPYTPTLNVCLIGSLIHYVVYKTEKKYISNKNNTIEFQK